MIGVRLVDGGVRIERGGVEMELAGIHIAEPGVALTDFGLALLAVVFAVALARVRGGAPSLRRRFVAFFAAVAVASLAGGLDHGFFRQPPGTAHEVLWATALLAIGASALALAVAAAELGFAGRTTRVVVAAAVAAFAAYALAVLLGARQYVYAIVAYLPATALMLGVLVVGWRRDRDPRLAAAIAGLLLTFVAAAIQRAGIGLHPRWFDHNALYHAVQAVALGLFFVGARGIVGQTPDRDRFERLADPSRPPAGHPREGPPTTSRSRP